MKIIFLNILLIITLTACTLWVKTDVISPVTIKSDPVVKELRNKYDVVWTFSWGLAKVMMWKKFGYVNLSWEEVIPVEYDFLWDMKLWAISAFQNNKCWLLSITWSTIIPFQYTSISTEISDDWLIAVESWSTYAIFNAYWNRLSDFQLWSFHWDSFKWGLLRVSKPNNFTIESIYVDVSGVQKKFWEYIVEWWDDWVYEVWNNDLLWFFDKNWNQITPFKYCWGFAEFQSWVRRVCFGDDQKWWFINNQGKEITDLNYDGAYNFSNERWLIEVNNKYWYIDQTWKEVIPPVYDYASDFHNDRAIVRTYYPWVERCPLDSKSFFSSSCTISRDQYKLELINLSGSVISELSYDEVLPFYGNMALVSSGSNIGFIDTFGHLRIPLIYDKDENMVDSYKQSNNFSNWFVLVAKNWKRVILYSDWFEKELSKDFGTR